MEIAAEAQLGMEAKEGVLPPGWFLGRGDGVSWAQEDAVCPAPPTRLRKHQ